MAQQLGLQEQKSSKLKDSASSLGSNIDHKMLDHMREDQLVQLYELLQATKDNNSENKNWYCLYTLNLGLVLLFI